MKFAAALLFAGAVWAQGIVLPEGAGKAETEKLCKQCHEVARSISLRQDKNGWQNTMSKMTAFGMKATETEYALVLEYLTKNYPAEEVARVKINEATAIELESGLTLKRSQARAVVAYRDQNGPFKSIDDLKKVPGLDAAMLDAKKDRIAF
jgi:competence protein ComEA